MSIIKHPEYEKDLKEILNTYSDVARETLNNDTVITTIILSITIIAGAYFKLPDALFISIVIAIACICLEFIFLERILALTLTITLQTAVIEWFSRIQISEHTTHET